MDRRGGGWNVDVVEVGPLQRRASQFLFSCFFSPSRRIGGDRVAAVRSPSPALFVSAFALWLSICLGYPQVFWPSSSNLVKSIDGRIVGVSAAAAGAGGGSSLYGSSSAVKAYSATEFRKNVINSNDVWIVEFFATWCGHCKSFAPEFEKAAKALAGIVKVAAVEDQSVMGDFGVKGFPTVKAFICNGGKSTPGTVDYNGARTASGVVDFALEQLRDVARARLSGSKSSGKSGGKGSGVSDVVVLTDQNFDKEVMGDEKNAWFVEFYAPWCGHCQSLAPDWERLASQVKGRVKVAKLDATKETVTARKFGVNGFPTLKMFPAGHKSVKSAIPYEGPRSLRELSDYALQFHSARADPEQLVSEEQFQDLCQKGICVLVLLPHIMDTKAAGRQKYLNDLKLVAQAAAPGLFTFLWSQGGDQLELEEQLNLAFGYPAVVALSLDKQMYAVHRGDFSQQSMRGFLRMKGAVDPLPKVLKKVVAVQKWDGKDAPSEPLEDDAATEEESGNTDGKHNKDEL